MPLDSTQLAHVRRYVGDTPPDSDLNGVYDRLLDADETIREVLDRRLANLAARPASFSVPGEYSQSTGENLKAIEGQLGRVGSVVKITEPKQPDCR